MSALKDLFETIVDDKKVKEFAESFGKGAPIMSNIVNYYNKKEKAKKYEETKKQILMEMQIREEIERERSK